MDFFANNTLSARDIFDGRKLYRENINLPQSIDFWDVNRLYGKVDAKGFPVSLSETNLKQLNAKKTMFAVDFVADAWNELLAYLTSSVLHRRIVLSFPFSNINIEQAWTSVNSLYHTHMKLLYISFFSEYVEVFSRQREIMDFEGFLKEFMGFARLYSRTVPITKGSFILSNRCPGVVSGLVIELKKDKHDNDQGKQTLLNNPSWSFWEQAIAKFGFVVNKNNPYQLIFNVGSKRAQKYYQNYGLSFERGGVGDLFQTYYYRVDLQQDVELLKTYLPQLYQSYQSARPHEVIGCKPRQRLPYIEKKEYNDRYWFQIYASIRFFESTLVEQHKEFETFLEKALTLFSVVDKDTALDYIQNQTKLVQR